VHVVPSARSLRPHQDAGDRDHDLASNVATTASRMSFRYPSTRDSSVAFSHVMVENFRYRLIQSTMRFSSNWMATSTFSKILKVQLAFGPDQSPNASGADE